jgi:energy-coupling factor transporter transmembrane protein EcfT
VRDFFRDRLNAAWVASALVLVAVLAFVPNSGAGTVVLIAAAVVVIGLSGAARLRDARRDRNRR